MKRILLTTVAAATISATAAYSGGIERSSQSVGILFEEGSYGEFSFSTVSPDVSGVFAGAVSSGDMAPSYQTFSFGYKQDIGSNLVFALIVDQPIGADVSYPVSAAPYPFFGATATIDSLATTGLLRYKMPSDMSFYGGVRIQALKAALNLPSGGGPYSLTVPTNTDYGYVLGLAYEKPEIALRVALTYNSKITHSLSDNGGTAFDVEIPQSVNLEFQSGVAADTLVFGSIRWQEWTKFNVSPPEYPANPLAVGAKDTTSYSLGVGRRFSEVWSAAVILGYESGTSGTVGNLSPTSGYKSIGLAATYKVNNVKITGGVRYVEVGDVTTSSIASSFTDNSAIGVGVKVGFNF